MQNVRVVVTWCKMPKFKNWTFNGFQNQLHNSKKYTCINVWRKSSKNKEGLSLKPKFGKNIPCAHFGVWCLAHAQGTNTLHITRNKTPNYCVHLAHMEQECETNKSAKYHNGGHLMQNIEV